MKLTYWPEGRNGPYWHAVTDDGGHDGSGPTPEGALASLILQWESETP